MTTSATVTRTKAVHPALVAGSIGGLCAVIGLVVGIAVGAGLANGTRSAVVPVSQTSALSPAGDRGLVYTGIPYSVASGPLSPAGDGGLVYTGIPYSASQTGR
jgi:hypothetical protein